MLGQQVPDVVLKTRVRDESIGGPNPFRWQDVSTGDVFAKGRHVLFALPDDTVVRTGHGADTTLGAERANVPGPGSPKPA